MAEAFGKLCYRLTDFRYFCLSDGLRSKIQSCILIFMTTCRHKKLVLLEKKAKKIRCRHCHLTIDEKELGSGCCPECQEVYGVRRRDFEDVRIKDKGGVEYRCEDCGAIIMT